MIRPIRLLSCLSFVFAVSAVLAQPQDSLKPEPKAAPPKTTNDRPPAADKPAASDKTPATEVKKIETPPGKRDPITAENNPTTKAGRGAPDLENPHSPSAWIYIDGKAGQFKEEGGQKLLQWFIDEPVSGAPKFRVEVFEPLLGNAKDFKAVLRTVDPVETAGSTEAVHLVYGLQAKEGTFNLGKEYSLLSPGENFTLRNGVTGDEIKEIAPLPSGKYAIAAGVKNAATGKETLAVTYFTVKNDE